MADDALQQIQRQVLWQRLIAVVEEQARTLVRSAFSTSTREAGDLSAGVFDPQGRMLAQAVTGTPGHINSMAASVGHFLAEFPAATMAPGDVFLTNDPWKGTGHLYDFVVVTPAFHRDRLVALFACTSHVVDIGGIGFSTEGREIYHEGLYLPILRLARGGVFDETVLRIIGANVREPVQVIGDVYSLAACNDIGARRLSEMLDEYGLHSLDELGTHILERSRAAMVQRIAELPRGSWHNTMRIDGVSEPIDLVCTLTNDGETLTVDFAGTSPAQPHGINVPMAYTDAYTSFGVRCIVGPDVPNNAGSLEVVRVRAPEGCVLNAPHPHAVNARHVVGQMLPDTVFGCLHQVLAGRVPAEGTSSLWNIVASGVGAGGRRWGLMSFHSGGAGARPGADGLSATAFPSGVRNMPVEINEAITPVVFWRKELRAGSGGAGRFRGGHGQVVELGSLEDEPFTLACTYERVRHPARGREGGEPGACGSIRLAGSGEELVAVGRNVVPAGERVVLSFPGGGGYGDPAERDPAAVEDERRSGLL
ncbi:MAG: hydantoinase B/oxoprolinase family protein [Acidimicrobiia bacterium]